VKIPIVLACTILLTSGNIRAQPATVAAGITETRATVSLAILDERGVRSPKHSGIVVVVTNVSSSPIGVDRYPGGHGEMDFRVDVRTSDGHPVKKTRYYRALLGESHEGDAEIPATSPVLALVAPGEKIKTWVNVGKLFELESGMQYEVSVQYMDPVSKKWIVSAPLAINIPK